MNSTNRGQKTGIESKHKRQNTVPSLKNGTNASISGNPYLTSTSLCNAFMVRKEGKKQNKSKGNNGNENKHVKRTQDCQLKKKQDSKNRIDASESGNLLLSKRHNTSSLLNQKTIINTNRCTGSYVAHESIRKNGNIHKKPASKKTMENIYNAKKLLIKKENCKGNKKQESNKKVDASKSKNQILIKRQNTSLHLNQKTIGNTNISRIASVPHESVRSNGNIHKKSVPKKNLKNSPKHKKIFNKKTDPSESKCQRLNKQHNPSINSNQKIIPSTKSSTPTNIERETVHGNGNIEKRSVTNINKKNIYPQNRKFIEQKLLTNITPIRLNQNLLNIKRVVADRKILKKQEDITGSQIQGTYGSLNRPPTARGDMLLNNRRAQLETRKSPIMEEEECVTGRPKQKRNNLGNIPIIFSTEILHRVRRTQLDTRERLENCVTEEVEGEGTTGTPIQVTNDLGIRPTLSKCEILRNIHRAQRKARDRPALSTIEEEDETADETNLQNMLADPLEF